VKIGDLAIDRLYDRLSGPGIRIQIGPFVWLLQSTIRQFLEPFRFGYRDFPIFETPVISDFFVRLTSTRWPRARGRFRLDGSNAFRTFPRHLTMPFTEWGFNWCIYTYAYRFLVIHSAVVEKDGRAVLLAGPPGSGKSTLGAALVGSKWRLLSDELALVRPEDARIAPIPRPVALKGESIALIRNLMPEAAIGPVFMATRKGTLAHLRPPIDAVERQGETALPGRVVFPTYNPAARTELRSVHRAEAFVRLAHSCFNYYPLGKVGFDCLAGVIDAADCYELSFARLDEALSAINSLATSFPAADSTHAAMR
jgi:HprK-related kinase A